MSYSQDATALTIDQQHVAIETCCGDLMRATRSSADIAVIGLLRMRLAGLLHANLASEEAAINSPLRRLPVARRPQSFIDLGAEAAQLRTRYSEHVGRWSQSTIRADRDGYGASVRELVGAVTQHLRAKRQALPEWRRAIAS